MDIKLSGRPGCMKFSGTGAACAKVRQQCGRRPRRRSTLPSGRGTVRVWVRVSVHVWVRVLTNGSSWLGACLGAYFVACWARVLVNRSSWFGVCVWVRVSVRVAVCTEQCEFVLRCVFRCVFWCVFGVRVGVEEREEKKRGRGVEGRGKKRKSEDIVGARTVEGDRRV